MTTGYRIQHQDRDTAELLSAEHQYSLSYSGQDEDIRHGISVCDSLIDLAAYIAQTGMIIDPHHSVIVHLAGEHSDDEPLDQHLGESLIIPTQILSVEPADDGFFALVNAAYDRIYA